MLQAPAKSAYRKVAAIPFNMHQPIDQSAEKQPEARRDGVARAFYALALATLIGVIVYLGRSIFIPLVIAAFLSFLMFTLKETIRQGPMIGRYMPHWLCYLVAFAMVVSAFMLFGEIIKRNAEELIAAAPGYEARLNALTAAGLKRLSGLGVIPDPMMGGVDDLRDRAISLINPVLREVGAAIRALTGNSVTIFLYTVFILVERGRIFSKIALLSVSDDRRRAVDETIADIGRLVGQYITVKTGVNFIVAMVSYFIMTSMNVDFAGFWALLIFALNFIPIVGAISAISAPVILSLVQPDGGGVQKALIVLALLVSAEQLMSSVIEPRLISKSVNLSPLIILLSLAVWGSLWGFAGMLMAVPVTVSVMIILTQFHSTRPIAVLLSADGRIAPLRHAPLSQPAAAAESDA